MFPFADGCTMGTVTRTSMLTRLGLLAGLAVVIVAIAVAAAASGGGAGSQKGGSPAATLAELRGIPQSGIALGSPRAPVTMVEFADLQCPFCAQYERDVLPAILKRYVRTGKVRLELRLLRFIGEDSDRLARVAAAASQQNRMWQFVALAYQRQGRENSGYATGEFIDRLAADAGLKRTSAGTAAERQVRQSEQAAKTLGVDSTPAFLIGPTGGPYTRFQPGDLTPGSFAPALDEALSR
jgi:protein-disulfide isomerase